MAPKRKKEADSKSPLSSRVICVTSADGYTGRMIVELLLDDDTYSAKYKQIVAVTASGSDDNLTGLGAKVITLDSLPDAIKGDGIDTLMLIPPASSDKLEKTKQVLETAKSAKTVVNLVLLSSAGCDYAERDKQPRLREFVDLEALLLQPKSDSTTEDTGHSPCIIRAGFYSENLLLFTKKAQEEGKLALPIGEDGKFAAVSLGDVALLAANALTSEGEHGLGDDFRGQMITVTGPLLTAGPELAKSASDALGKELKFVAISEEEAKEALKTESSVELDDAEHEYLLEYYSLVREGKTAYVSTAAFKQLCGQDVNSPDDFFKLYKDDFKPVAKKRKVE